MIIHTMEQRTEAWDDIRAGKITGSVASKLVTPTGKRSTQAAGEIGRIIAEAQGWQPPEFIKPTFWMERGVDLEDESRNWLQIVLGMKIIQCGFMEHDSGLAGFSPDGYIMDGEQVIPVELKTPKPSTHITWVLQKGLPKVHHAQCHMGMVIADAPYMHFQSYCPNAAPLIERVEWSDYTDTMKTALDEFIVDFEKARELIIGEINEQ